MSGDLRKEYRPHNELRYIKTTWDKPMETGGEKRSQPRKLWKSVFWLDRGRLKTKRTGQKHCPLVKLSHGYQGQISKRWWWTRVRDSRVNSSIFIHTQRGAERLACIPGWADTCGLPGTAHRAQEQDPQQDPQRPHLSLLNPTTRTRKPGSGLTASSWAGTGKIGEKPVAGRECREDERTGTKPKALPGAKAGAIWAAN